MRKPIPSPIISILSDLLPQIETHASLDSLFLYADAPGDPPVGSKPVKVQEWLRRTNKSPKTQPLEVLGKILERYLEEDLDEDSDGFAESKLELRSKIDSALKKANLRYYANGIISGADANQVRSLESEIKALNVDAVDYEFKRALENADNDPYEAVSAACNLLESIFKVIIEGSGVDLPKTQDLAGLWKVAKNQLGLEPGQIEDQDLLKILSGLSSIITGTAALRTHASSAHGRGKFRYSLESRHVLLAIHSSHALALFVLQTRR